MAPFAAPPSAGELPGYGVPITEYIAGANAEAEEPMLAFYCLIVSSAVPLGRTPFRVCSGMPLRMNGLMPDAA